MNYRQIKNYIYNEKDKLLILKVLYIKFYI